MTTTIQLTLCPLQYDLHYDHYNTTDTMTTTIQLTLCPLQYNLHYAHYNTTDTMPTTIQLTRLVSISSHYNKITKCYHAV
jgi:hypothetical protein